MRDALFQPASPVHQPGEPRRQPHHAPVEEEEIVAVVAAAPVAATPFFDNAGQRKILLKGGTVVNCDGSQVADVLIEGGSISAVGQDLEGGEDALVLDAEGKMVLPGGIDCATNLREAKGGVGIADDFESGTRAALAGGTTMVVDQVMPTKEQSILECYNEWKQDAEEKACCDYAFRWRRGEHVRIRRGVSNIALISGWRFRIGTTRSRRRSRS